MPKPRCSGRSTSMRLSSSQMLPPVSDSKPARQLSAVDLPQPDGPSRAMNSPRRIVRLRESRASAPPKRRVTWSSFSSPKPCTAPYLIFAAPMSSSHLRKAATWPFASSGISSGLSAIHFSYSGRPNSLIACWLSAGAIEIGTFFTAGPG